MILPNRDMILFCIYFYVTSLNHIRNQYVAGVGLYWDLRLWYFVEAVANVILNLVLGYFYGISGIVFATIITVVLFNFITRNTVLFKKYFKRSTKEFYIQHIACIIVTLIVCTITYWICSYVSFGGITELAIKAVICVFVPNILYLAFYFRTNLFKEMVSLLKTVFSSKLGKKA